MVKAVNNRDTKNKPRWVNIAEKLKAAALQAQGQFHLMNNKTHQVTVLLVALAVRQTGAAVLRGPSKSATDDAETQPQKQDIELIVHEDNANKPHLNETSSGPTQGTMVLTEHHTRRGREPERTVGRAK